LAQIEIVKEQFTRVLAGMYHTRIDYPAASGGITAEFGGSDGRASDARTTDTVPANPLAAGGQSKS
jgi:hypothetical protein